MDWVMENWPTIVFLATTLLSAFIALLKHLGKKKTAGALDEIKDILHQTFGNVEQLKEKWKESGAEEKYGHIGEIFAKINKEEDMGEILKTAYEQWKKEQKEKKENKKEENNG